jgi:VIT1/CCC1 family predicted Fe2+/Mn2+ transporter
MAIGDNEGLSSKAESYNDDNTKALSLKEEGLLSPMERIAEVIYGIIMALTFTGTLSIAKANTTEVREMLLAAIGCNIAWGFVDGVMYVLTNLTTRLRGRTLIRFLRENPKSPEAQKLMADFLPPIITSVLTTDDLNSISRKLQHLPATTTERPLRPLDFRNGLAIFLFVFLSTFPVAVPFLFTKDVRLALRISNIVAIILMFICGWLLGRYGGSNKLVMGIAIAVIGAILVITTIALGG